MGNEGNISKGEGVRTDLLQLVPVLALRELVYLHLDEPGAGPVIRERFRSVLGRQPRDYHRATGRLTREQLIRLITASPEITAEEIVLQYEEHRYGLSPSFYIDLFDPGELNPGILAQFRETVEKALDKFNSEREKELPNVRRVALNDLGQMHDRPEIIEATYRFQSRLDYVDEEENVVSPYETLYGFFWVNTADGYVIMQARNQDVLKAMRDAIERAAGVRLTALVITKRFKNALAFLPMEQMRSVKLHDPLPDSPSFRWLSITDDHLVQKNYQSWEERYPEVRSARYRTMIGDIRETMLTIRCDQGALSLAGAIPASLFREWCLNSLGEVIRVHHNFRKNPGALVPTLDLTGKPEMTRFNAVQKERILNLTVALLTVKSSTGADFIPVDCSPLEIAAVLGTYVTVQLPYFCTDQGCDPEEEMLFTCENCGKTDFYLQQTNEAWEVVCREHRTKRLAKPLPLEVSCANGHPMQLTVEKVIEKIIIVPGWDLLNAMAGIINNYLKGFSFNHGKETFFIHGRNLLYFPDRNRASDRITIIQNIGTVETGGRVTAIETKGPPG